LFCFTLTSSFRRVRISDDPNNTAWSRSTTAYGHRQLLAQGWSPGQTLGAANAPHAHLHSNASHSHIRIQLREDNSGLGVKKGSGQAAGVCTGLDAFQAMLGRLNGKGEEALEREQRSRDDLRRAMHVERKGWLLNFVRGETLVGDDVLRLKQELDGVKLGKAQEESKRSQIKTEEVEERVVKIEEGEPAIAMDAIKQEGRSTKDRKEKKLKRRRRDGESAETSPGHFLASESIKQESGVEDSSSESEKTRKASRKEEKVMRREEREAKRKRKQTRSAAREHKEGSNLSGTPVLLPPEAEAEFVRYGTSAPVKAVSSGGRHHVRQRYIRQKRAAMMDPQALKEVCMAQHVGPYSDCSRHSQILMVKG